MRGHNPGRAAIAAKAKHPRTANQRDVVKMDDISFWVVESLANSAVLKSGKPVACVARGERMP